MKFEWDEHKNQLNQQKHGVDFEEAGTIFNDPLALSFEDPDNSINEHRMMTFGISRFGKMLIVSHTERNRKIRIISARLMTKHERNIYENG
jgi:uncharacterized DUF497 family protein